MPKLGSSGVFKAIVEGARKVKRALSESDAELAPDVQELCSKVGQLFVSSRFADVYAMTTSNMQQRISRQQFEESWQDAVRERGPFTGFEFSDSGEIEIHYIPGLEEVPQSEFIAFVEVAFSSAGVPLEDEKAFTLGVVWLAQDGEPRIGALHTQ